MKAFLLLLAILLGCLIAGALLGYPAFALIHQLNPHWPFHRVVNRVSMLLLLVCLIWLLKHLRVNDRQSLGYGLGRREFATQAAAALGIGIAGMLPVAGMLYGLEIRIADPQSRLTAGGLLSLVLQGLASGLVVAFIEETVLRGAMHSAIERESGPRAAIGLTALIYAALHFLNKTRIPADQVDWGSGIELLRGVLGAFAHPAALFDSFLALFAVGVLLGLVRQRTGAIAACIGLHAGWVCVISVTREITARNGDSPLGFLVGSYDGVVGYLVLAWTLGMIAAVYRWRGSVRPQPARP